MPIRERQGWTVEPAKDGQPHVWHAWRGDMIISGGSLTAQAAQAGREARTGADSEMAVVNRMLDTVTEPAPDG